MEYKWRKLDNTAKLFSMDGINNTSMFRISGILTEEIEPLILKKAVDIVLKDYPGFKVKTGSGLFWNYLEYNFRKPKISIEEGIPCKHINFRKNNNYLFKVSYYKNKINLDIYHVLTDGGGASLFFKAIICRYLEIKYGIKHSKKKENITFEDLTLKHYDKKYISKKENINTFKIKQKSSRRNNTFHYILSTKEIKKISKNNNVSITMYIVALYIYALYLSFYEEKEETEFNIIVPINLRNHFEENTFVNCFTYMNIVSDFKGRKDVPFEEVLKRVQSEFKEKYTKEKIKTYLANDVKVGVNLGIRIVPLFIKKIFVRILAYLRISTSIVSNIGSIEFEEKYKEYIENVLLLVMPNKLQKIKCSVSSYKDNLNITINSNINDLHFEKIFYELLFEKFKKLDIISNDEKRSNYVSNITK